MQGIQTATCSFHARREAGLLHRRPAAAITPAVLAQYAGRYHAVPGRWFFLTGDQTALEALCRNGFKLGDVDGSLVHSTRFVLMDRSSRVRGFYSTSEDTALPRLLHDIRSLRGEKS